MPVANLVRRSLLDGAVLTVLLQFPSRMHRRDPVANILDSPEPDVVRLEDHLKLAQQYFQLGSGDDALRQVPCGGGAQGVEAMGCDTGDVAVAVDSDSPRTARTMSCSEGSSPSGISAAAGALVAAGCAGASAACALPPPA